MKKVIALIGVMFLLVGWTYDNNSPYIICDCSLGNNIKIVLPVDKVEYFKYNIEEDKIWNESSAIIYGYYGSDTRIAFPSYGEPYYNYNYSSVDLSISDLLEVNLYPSTSLKIKSFGTAFIITILGGIFVCLFKGR